MWGKSRGRDGKAGTMKAGKGVDIWFECCLALCSLFSRGEFSVPAGILGKFNFSPILKKKKILKEKTKNKVERHPRREGTAPPLTPL